VQTQLLSRCCDDIRSPISIAGPERGDVLKPSFEAHIQQMHREDAQSEGLPELRRRQASANDGQV